jgi:DNA-binding response OmpR family regulator
MQKILVVEDDEDILLMVAKLLRKNHFEVLTVSDCSKAVNTAKTSNPDLILMDINLGPCDGREICLNLKAEQLFTIPIILFSANTELEPTTSHYRADGFIQKPFEGNALVENLRHYLQNSRAADIH